MAKLKYIRFSSYKKFEETTEIEIKPLTVLIGKIVAVKVLSLNYFQCLRKQCLELAQLHSCLRMKVFH